MDKSKLKTIVNGLLYIGIALWLWSMTVNVDNKLISIYSMIVALGYLLLWKVKPYSTEEGKSPLERFEQISVIVLFASMLWWIFKSFVG